MGSEAGRLLDAARLDDLGRLEKIAGKPLVRGIVESFLAETPRRMERMREALGRSDAEGLAFVAHSLKGSSGQIGALRVAAVSAELEAVGRKGSLEDASAPLADLDREMGRVAPLLAERAAASP